MVSDVSKDIYKCENNGNTVRDEKTSKLLLSLYDKENMLFIFVILEYYLGKGLVLKNVHRCIKCSQSAWLKECIDFITEKRKEATNGFGK